MTPERRQRIESLCLEALARDADARTAFLDEACAGDAALRREVDSLLVGRAGAAEFLEKPAWQAPSTPLTPGTRLGPYEIDAAIGAGGMGEVYRARDTRLGRTVAIKVLPAGVSSDPERRRRFEQEARAASALNHPHICTLHDIGDAVPTNSQSPIPRTQSSVSFLVMEHLDGQTLAARLTKGKLPVAQALDIGIQIADALSAAHKHGIVHRDLKPGNVMLVKGDGGAPLQVKLLDFGLAKLRPSLQSPEGDGSGVPTVTAPATTKGMVVGTVPYMAPEQVEGKPTDARTDLFALGTVLYEMVTGTRAFGGDSSAAVMAAILEREPRPLAEIAPLTPPALDRVIRRCLAKDPEARWDSAHDVADELRWLRDAGDGAASTMRTEATARWSRRHPLGLLTAGIVLGACVIGALMWQWRPVPPRATVTRLAIPVSPADEVNAGGGAFTLTPTAGGSRTAFAWTPDGQALVFVGRRAGVQRLYIRRLDAAEPTPLPNTEGAQVPAVSPDGEWVAFWSGNVIKKVLLAGGPALELFSRLTTPPRGLVWDAPAGLLAGRADGGIWKIPPEGKPAPLTTLGEGELGHGLPSLLPGGKVLLYTVRRREWSWGDEEVVAQTLATGARTVLLKDAVDARYVPSGHLLFLRRGVLFAVPFDAERLQRLGPEVPLLDGVAQALTGGQAQDCTGAGQFAVASTGTLAWIPSPVRLPEQARLVMVDRHGQVTPLPAPVRGYGPAVRLSPNRRGLAVTVRTLTEVSLSVFDLTGPVPPVPLTTEGEAMWPVWTRGGQELAFLWVRSGKWALATQVTNGTAPAQVLVPGRLPPSSVAPDGRIAAVAVTESSRAIVIVAAENGNARVDPLIQTPNAEFSPEFSPDGRWLLYVSNLTGQDATYLRTYAGSDGAVPVSSESGVSPAWRPDGREIFFVVRADPGGRDRMMAVAFTPGSPPVVGRPVELFSFDPRTLRMACTPTRCYDVAPDGQAFYAVQLVTPPPPPVVTHINLIQNWFEELKAKVPIK